LRVVSARESLPVGGWEQKKYRQRQTERRAKKGQKFNCRVSKRAREIKTYYLAKGTNVGEREESLERERRRDFQFVNRDHNTKNN